MNSLSFKATLTMTSQKSHVKNFVLISKKIARVSHLLKLELHVNYTCKEFVKLLLMEQLLKTYMLDQTSKSSQELIQENVLISILTIKMQLKLINVKNTPL
jgi:hypothetical protein